VANYKTTIGGGTHSQDYPGAVNAQKRRIAYEDAKVALGFTDAHGLHFIQVIDDDYDNAFYVEVERGKAADPHVERVTKRERPEQAQATPTERGR
jgi:hypothetical protein